MNLPESEAAINPDEWLKSMGLTLPPVPKPVASYRPAVLAGSLLLLSGQGPVGPGFRHTGKVGAQVSVEDAYQHARLTGLNLLAVIRSKATQSLHKTEE